MMFRLVLLASLALATTGCAVTNTRRLGPKGRPVHYTNGMISSSMRARQAIFDHPVTTYWWVHSGPHRSIGNGRVQRTVPAACCSAVRN